MLEMVGHGVGVVLVLVRENPAQLAAVVRRIEGHNPPAVHPVVEGVPNPGLDLAVGDLVLHKTDLDCCIPFQAFAGGCRLIRCAHDVSSCSSYPSCLQCPCRRESRPEKPGSRAARRAVQFTLDPGGAVIHVGGLGHCMRLRGMRGTGRAPIESVAVSPKASFAGRLTGRQRRRCAKRVMGVEEACAPPLI